MKEKRVQFVCTSNRRGKEFEEPGYGGERTFIVSDRLTFILHSPFKFYDDLLSSEFIKERLGVNRHRLQK
jgi:hypothetical protein